MIITGVILTIDEFTSAINNGIMNWMSNYDLPKDLTAFQMTGLRYYLRSEFFKLEKGNGLNDDDWREDEPEGDEDSESSPSTEK